MSTALALLVCFALVVGAISIFSAMIKSKHFFSCFFFSVLTGAGSLLIVHFTSLMTGFSLPVNWVSLCASAIGGIPAVLAMAVTKFI